MVGRFAGHVATRGVGRAGWAASSYGGESVCSAGSIDDGNERNMQQGKDVLEEARMSCFFDAAATMHTCRIRRGVGWFWASEWSAGGPVGG